ncbi:coiled-coil domain-containing protein 115 isoform X3 [Dendrobium catenatum]|uniref:coiled-coil domain-containing protein 115 isoform X3 n=1 Tax=Dendrobium catenatum TaxID=906689 RepID=UPI00109F3077|nr:coiled-coil domain-containing protein 115 isoform X3 [Dendrobium catenatum]
MADDNACSLVQASATNGELEGEEQALLFLDSLDSYLMLLDSLSSSLRQGWLELASARHSMGPSRLSSTLLDLKVQSAATTVMLNELVEESQSERIFSPEVVDGSLLKDCNSTWLRHRRPKHVHDVTLESTAVDENVRALSLSKNSSTTSKSVDENKRRYKSLSVFGALVSPKLRAAQVSFETGSAYDLVDLWFAGSIGPWPLVVLRLAVLEHSVLSLFPKLLELKFSSSLISKRWGFNNLCTCELRDPNILRWYISEKR